MFRAEVVSSTRVPVSQHKSLNDLAVTVESAPTSAYHLSASAMQISHSVSRNENNDVCSMSSQYGDFHATVVSRALQIITRFSKQFEKHALGCLDHTLICLTSDIASLETTGQCTSAVMKVPESLYEFVEDFAIQVRPSRCSCGTCCSLF